MRRLAVTEVDGTGVGFVTRPDRNRQLRGGADEPEVLEVVGGSSLAGNGLVNREGVLEGVRRAVGGVEHLGEGLGCHLGHAWVEHLRGVVLVLVDGVAVAVGDLGDGHRIAVIAAAGEHRIGLGHLERRGAVGAQDRGAVRLELGGDAHVLRRGDDLVHANGHAHLHIGSVKRARRGLGERLVAV